MSVVNQQQHHASPSLLRTLHVGQPNLCDRKIFDQIVNEIFDRRWFSNNGTVVRSLEKQLQEYLGVKHAITVCNATTGLQLACSALDISGEVIMPAFTFVATPHAARWLGLKPVFADVSLDNHLIDPAAVASKISSKTSAIIGVHLWGQMCDVQALQSIASENGLALLLDASHAFGCGHQGQLAGGFGNCEVFSFSRNQVPQHVRGWCRDNQ